MISKSKLLQVLDCIILVSLFFILVSISIDRNKRTLEGVIWSDVEGYYMYLPAVFIYHDVHKVPERSMNHRRNDKGEIVMKYTCGIAFFYLPFFLWSHVHALNHQLDASGFSDSYYYGMIYCGVFWAILGLLLLKLLLSKYFNWVTTWVILLCILYGTNFYHYATKAVGMSHVYSFALVAGILLLLDSYYKSPGKAKAVSLGMLFGWLVLIRPTNVLFLVFIFLYNVVSISDIKNRLLFFKQRASDILIAAPFFILILVPQLLYWKTMTGKWIVYSYEGEGFIYWEHPKILEVLFDTQNGLLLYSPVLLLMIPGLLLGRKDRRANVLGVVIVFSAATYIFASWWAWWFGAAFGHRCYIEYFPLLAFPMAIAVEKLDEMKKVYWVLPIAIVIAVLCYYSVHMSLLTDYVDVWDGPKWRWNYDLWWKEINKMQ